MRKIKSILCVVLIVLLIVESIPYNALAYQQTKNYSDIDRPRQIKITNDEYKAYEQYGIMISEDYLGDKRKESKYNIIENLLKDQTVLSSQKMGNGVYFETYQYNNIGKLLPDFDSLIEVAFIKDKEFSRYCITYNTLNNEYVNLEYYNNGLETKTILNKISNELTILNNNNEKTLYENFVGTTLELTDEQKEEIKALIAAGKIDKLKLMENIEVQEIDNTIIVNLKKHNTDRSNLLAAPSYKSNATPIYSSFPTLNKQFITSRTVWSDALYSYGKSDCYVYAKVYKKRLYYEEVKFDFKTFFIDSAFDAIGAYLGCGSTVVEFVVYYAGISWAIVGGMKAIKEIADMARDAEYEYYGEKSGYVFDKTTYNADVKVYTNIGYGTFDGGLLPNGEWAWIESPPSPAYDVPNSTILDNAVYNYNCSIWLGEGYCVGYYPE